MSTKTNPRSAEAPEAPPAPRTEQPQELTAEQLQLLASTGEVSATGAGEGEAPAMAPPGSAAGLSASAAGATISGQKINALWADQTNRNSWAHLETAGWKRLSPLSDSGSTNMTLLAGHARATGHAPYANEDPAGTIAYMYVW
ncbi:hypothetical protein [Nocardioides sp.]|uniref:hypothetical protein n=1 Tax=Nocardioides sp. TaxID=35761 RepID=UPI0035693DCC